MGHEEGGRKPRTVGGGDDDVIAESVIYRSRTHATSPHCHPMPQKEIQFSLQRFEWKSEIDSSGHATACV